MAASSSISSKFSRGWGENARRSVWTLSPLLEEANRVSLWRCERFFDFPADLKAPKDTTSAVRAAAKDKASPAVGGASTAVSQHKEAAIVVNGELPEQDKFLSCWNAAHVRVCADGGSNRVFKLDKEKYIPDHIVGDLDSSTPDVLEHYKKKGVSIVHDSNQDLTDLQKALVLVKKIEIIPDGVFDVITILGGLGGCLTHELGNLNSLFHLAGTRVFMVSPRNVAFLLPKGRHLIRIVKKREDFEDDDEGTKEEIDTTYTPPRTVYCGLLPLGEKVVQAHTKGLRWDLKGQPLSFGGLVSTSNEFLHNVAEVEVSSPTLFTFDFRKD